MSKRLGMRGRWPLSLVFGRALGTTLVAVFAVEIWRAFETLHRASVTAALTRQPAGSSVAQMQSANTTVHDTVVATFVCLVAAGLLFVAWRYELARIALRRIDPVRSRLRWPIGGWFVPLLDVVGPRLLVDAFWQRAAWRHDRHAPLYVRLWWGAFFVVAIVERVFTTGSTSTPGDAVLLDHRRAFAALLEAVVALLGVGVVSMLTRRRALAVESDVAVYPTTPVVETSPGYVR